MAPSSATPAPRSADTTKRERSIYLGERIKALQAEIKTLLTEKRDIMKALHGQSDRQSPEAKTLKRRRDYITKRPEEAKTELTALIAERRALVGDQAHA